jgi:ubiquinone/menaquinone biosynthesis C-methylase UbiE
LILISGLRRSYLFTESFYRLNISVWFEEIALEHENSLKRKLGEGSFVGVKKPKMPEELVEWFRHLYAYKYASSFARGRVVLDVGCGSGYGVNELSAVAQTVIGIDILRDRIVYCHSRYGDRASFIQASALNLPFRENQFDLVTSFQVIEHIDPRMVNLYLEEVKYVLKNAGVFIVSTPNRKLRLLPLQKPWNPDHKKEYDSQELRRVLERAFPDVRIVGLSASRVAYLVEYNRVKQNPFHVYLIHPAVSLMSRILLNFTSLKKLYMRFGLKNILHKTRHSEIGSCNITLKDFNISSDDLDTCLDLYGICKNEKLVMEKQAT